MKKIEIKDYYDTETKQSLKALFVDDKLFDWNIDTFEIERARQAFKDETARKAIHANIQDHFLRCFSLFLGKEIRLREVIEAIEKGVIDA